jgi:hypothetical protein
VRVLWWRNNPRPPLSLPEPTPGKWVRTLVVETEPDEGVTVRGLGVPFEFTVHGRLISTTWEEAQ